MTRTERNTYPAAVLRDRHSRSGLNASTEALKKNGAGAHNWGSFQQESELVLEADLDAQRDLDDVNVDGTTDTQEAKDELAEVTTSPASSNSSLETAQVIAGAAVDIPNNGRRLSNVSDEERERARVYREGLIKRGSFDLASIARTSFGAQSPPSVGYLGTSPTDTKAVGRQ